MYLSEGGHPARLSRLHADGTQHVLVEGLPGPGNYHLNMAVVGPDGKLYFSQGAMTNLGICLGTRCVAQSTYGSTTALPTCWTSARSR
jgi:glucose/arabinose dehydrogenase